MIRKGQYCERLAARVLGILAPSESLSERTDRNLGFFFNNRMLVLFGTQLVTWSRAVLTGPGRMCEVDATDRAESGPLFAGPLEV